MILGTTAIVTILAIGLLGINNAFSQGNDTGILENDKIMSINATLPTTIISNATLAFAQEDFQTKDLVNETIDLGNNTGKMGTDYDNKMKLNGTINVYSTIGEAFKSKVTTDIIGAIEAAQASVGPNSVVKEAELTEVHGFLVYKITVVDESMKKHKVIVDPGNGQVLMTKEVTWYDEHKKMKYGDDERHDKYDKYSDDSHGYDDYDDKNKMMMKDKKY
ncbi:MAG: PepSY domain-containing protein [Nitrososphaeraceae archaeon]